MAKLKRKQKEGMASLGPIEVSHLESTIIASFFPEAEEMTIKEIQEGTDYSYERVNSALKSLKEKNIVAEKQKGKTLLYSLDLKNLYSQILGFNSYMLQKEIDFIRKHKSIYPAIKEIIDNQSILMVILFGSYSKGTETKESDIDLICIPIQGSKQTENLILSLNHKYGINFSPVIVPYLDFPNIKKDNPELWNDLKLYGTVFKGDEYFYSWMYKYK